MVNILDNKTKSELVFGRRPVLEIIENGKINVNKIWISEGFQDRALKDRVILFAKEKKTPYFIVPNEKLNNLSENKNHQGIILSISPIEYLSINELVDNTQSSNLKALGSNVILIAHEIEDTHNLGAMIRTFVAAGGKGIILTGRSSVGINASTIKTSAGALFQAEFARATNCSQVIEKLKKKDFWIAGTDNSSGAKSLYEIDFPDKIAIVVGNEHEGLPRLVKENCDFLAKIPISNKVNSLNVSVAFGIVLFEYLRQHTPARSS